MIAIVYAQDGLIRRHFTSIDAETDIATLAMYVDEGLAQATDKVFYSEAEPSGQQGYIDLSIDPPIAFLDQTAPKSHDELVAVIVSERGRRLARGFDYDFGDARGVHRIGTSDQDMRGWDDVTRLAGAMINSAIDTPIAIITETGPTTVTPSEWQLILVAAGEFGQPIWQASFLLQAMDPIPQDITDNAYWPGA